MNRIKQFIYDFRKHAPKPETIDSWLNKYKHGTWLKTYKECLGIETRPKHRHRRSFIARYENRLFGNKQTYTAFYIREVKVIGRYKHRKYLYTSKRAIL